MRDYCLSRVPLLNPRKGVLRILRHEEDPGPGLKLLGAVREELAAGRGDTLVIYGDDDIWDHTNPPHPQKSYLIYLLNSNRSE